MNNRCKFSKTFGIADAIITNVKTPPNFIVFTTPIKLEIPSP